MKHLFRATKIGWEKEKEGVWFDSDAYSKEEAEAEFKPYQGTTQRGYPYTGYERDGQKYHDVTYLGEFEDDELPRVWAKRPHPKRGRTTIAAKCSQDHQSHHKEMRRTTYQLGCRLLVLDFYGSTGEPRHTSLAMQRSEWWHHANTKGREP